MPLADFAASEARFAMLARSDPSAPAELLALAQADVDERWRYYEQLAGVERTAHDASATATPPIDARMASMTDLTTSYLGLELRSPIVASARSADRATSTRCGRLEEAGRGGRRAAVAVRGGDRARDAFAVDSAPLDRARRAFAEALSYLPELDDYDVGPRRHLAARRAGARAARRSR